MGSEPKSGGGWQSTPVQRGIRTVTCHSWAGYVNFLNEALLDYRSYIFRGHTSERWRLQSTLDRALNASGSASNSANSRSKHLEAFKYAARGRRGLAPNKLSEDGWWALGQHNGLATPLLDWSESPYVAAYFAFCDERDAADTSDRVIFALSRRAVETKSKELERSAGGSKGPIKTVTFVRPMADDNPRLITQRGLFTRAPDNTAIEDWIEEHFGRTTSRGAKLIKITAPDDARPTALKSLNRMNINHLSLFPDLYGAAKYCNFELQIDKY